MRATPAPVTTLRSPLRRGLSRLSAAFGLLAVAAGCASQPAPQRTVSVAPPATPTAPQAAKVDYARPLPVALLSPRSAPRAEVQAFAADVEAAARLIAQTAAAPGIDLRVYDTGATAAGATTAANAALAAGAALILGPAFSDTTQAVRPLAAAQGVTVLSMSSDRQAAGDTVWVLGDLPENDADRIMGFVAAQGVRSVAIVRPDNVNGAVADRAARAAAARNGITVAQGVTYPRSFEGVQTAITAAAPDILASGVDSLLLADSGQALSIVAAFLDFNEVSPRETRFIGLGSWRGPETLQEPSLRGGLFAGVDLDAGAPFEEAFRAQTGRSPHPRAWLGHDAAQVAIAALQAGRLAGDATPFDAAALTRSGGFAGARGPFTLTPDGGNRRALGVFEVTADGFALADPPAPATGL